MSSVYIKCSYIRRDGSVCNKGSVRGICAIHVHCNPQRPCRICGRGTQSASGYCYAAGACRNAQRVAIVQKFYAKKKLAVNAATSPLPITSAELDALVEELLV
jgi:hypothetical protein